MEMIIKGQPKELDGKPLISEGNTDFYLGRVIIELWQGEEPEAVTDEPAFAWTIDKSNTNNLSKDDWLRRLFNGLQRATRHIEDVSQ